MPGSTAFDPINLTRLSPASMEVFAESACWAWYGNVSLVGPCLVGLAFAQRGYRDDSAVAAPALPHGIDKRCWALFQAED